MMVFARAKASSGLFPEIAMKKALRVSRPSQIVITLVSVPLALVRGGAKPPPPRRSMA